MTIEDVENLAELAKLELTDNEKEKSLKIWKVFYLM